MRQVALRRRFWAERVPQGSDGLYPSERTGLFGSAFQPRVHELRSIRASSAFGQHVKEPIVESLLQPLSLSTACFQSSFYRIS